LGHTDVTTAKQFAFKALGEGNFQKGLMRVVFPRAVSYYFRFERMGLMGFNLTQAQEQQEEAQFV
jgi:hypothetical protein